VLCASSCPRFLRRGAPIPRIRAFVERARGPPPRRSIRLIDDDPCRECAAFRTSAGRSVPSLFCFCSRRDADGLFAAAIMPRLERPDDNSRAASCHHRTCWPKITIADCFNRECGLDAHPFHRRYGASPPPPLRIIAVTEDTLSLNFADFRFRYRGSSISISTPDSPARLGELLRAYATYSRSPFPEIRKVMK